MAQSDQPTRPHGAAQSGHASIQIGAGQGAGAAPQAAQFVTGQFGSAQLKSSRSAPGQFGALAGMLRPCAPAGRIYE